MSIVTLPPTAAPPAQLSLFDYNALPPEARDWACNTTSQIKQEITQLAGLVRQTAWSVWRLGRGLAEMQEKLTPLGQFSAWVEAEVPTLSRATAYNAIAAYRAFPSGLPQVDGETLEMPLKALYLLASPSADPVRDWVIEQAAETGAPITIEAVKQAVAERGATMYITPPASLTWPLHIQKEYAEIVSAWSGVVCAFANAQPYHIQQAKRLGERLRAIGDRYEPNKLIDIDGVSRLGPASVAMDTLQRWIHGAQSSIHERERKAVQAPKAAAPAVEAAPKAPPPPAPAPARLSRTDREALDQIFFSFSLFSPTEPDAVTVAQRDQTTQLLRDLNQLRDRVGEHPDIDALASQIQRWRMGMRDGVAPVAAAASAPVVITETSAPEWRTAGERLLVECDEDLREAAFALEVDTEPVAVLAAGIDRLIEDGKLHPALEAAIVAALRGDAEATLGDVLAERLMEADGRANQYEAAAELLAVIVEVA